MLGFTSTGFILIFLWYILLHLLTILFNLPIYTFLIFKLLIFLHYGLNTFLSSFLSHDFIDLLQNLMSLFTRVFFGLWLDSFKNISKTLVIAIPFLSFKETTHAYSLETSVAYNKDVNSLLNLLINCISARSSPKFCL